MPVLSRPNTHKHDQMNRTIEHDVLYSFIDMPVVDAVKILKISAHTFLKIRRMNGLSKWPFDTLKQGTYKMSWPDVESLRSTQLMRDDLDEQTRQYLTAAQKRGWLMRKLYGPKQDRTKEGVLGWLNDGTNEEEGGGQAPSAQYFQQNVEEESAVHAENQDAPLDWQQDYAGDGNQIHEHVLQSPQHFLEQDIGQESVTDRFFLHTLQGDEQGILQWPYRDEDEEEWGILGEGL